MNLRFVSFLVFVFSTLQINGQEEHSTPKVTPSVDIYSAYVWRGSLFGNGTAYQPSLAFASAGFTAGIWGSFDLHGYQEADPYINYEFPWGLNIGITDYYYPVLKSNDFSRETGSHALEINTGYTLKGFSLSANYILNEAGGAGSSGNDMYFEAGYATGIFSVFVGAGNGWHTPRGNFRICNIGIGAVKKLRVGEKFFLPVSGQLIVNPETRKFYIITGISF